MGVFVSERLEKEREILEERADKRVEILKNLVSKTVDLSAVNNAEEKVMKTQNLSIHDALSRLSSADY